MIKIFKEPIIVLKKVLNLIFMIFYLLFMYLMINVDLS